MRRVDKDPVYSDKLVGREDFQAVFRRFRQLNSRDAVVAGAIAVLSKPRESRGEEELHAVLDWLLSIPNIRYCMPCNCSSDRTPPRFSLVG
jgi:hypothetical protein